MIDRYQLIQNLVWSGWYTQEAAQDFADQADLSALDPHFPMGADGQQSVERPDRYGRGPIPYLFDAIDGISRELALYVAAQERAARLERGDDDAGDLVAASDFNERGVVKICNDLLSEIRQGRQTPTYTEGHCAADGKPRHKNWCYALHVYCRHRGRRAPSELLCLTFEVLGCVEFDPDPGLKSDLGMTHRRKQGQFEAALYLDAENWARYGRQCSDEKLATRVSDRVDAISDKQISKWRREPEYRRRIRFSVCDWLHRLERNGESTCRDEVSKHFNLRSGGRYILEDGETTLIERTRDY